MPRVSKRDFIKKLKNLVKQRTGLGILSIEAQKSCNFVIHSPVPIILGKRDKKELERMFYVESFHLVNPTCFRYSVYKSFAFDNPKENPVHADVMRILEDAVNTR